MSCKIFLLSTVTSLVLAAAAAVLVFKFFATRKDLEEEPTMEIKIK
ncbi:MAG TPA: hypothetical protein VFP25_00270 [Nitrososphaeraceae archaeon]|nr:hypothetical protein [Nitrososphaeraceae archaeon]